MNDFMDKAKDRAKDLAADHDDQVDTGIARAGEVFDKRTGDRYDEQSDKGVTWAQEHTRGDDGH